MNRISQFFKKFIPASWQKPAIPEPKKPEIDKMSSGGTVRTRRRRRFTGSPRRANRILHLKQARKNSEKLPTISFGTFRRFHRVKGQKTGMQKSQERMNAV